MRVIVCGCVVVGAKERDRDSVCVCVAIHAALLFVVSQRQQHRAHRLEPAKHSPSEHFSNNFIWHNVSIH